MTGEILVIGATGTVGAHVLAELFERGEKARGATRDPAGAARRIALSAEWVELDLDRPETFRPALQGVDRVFLIARPGDEQADRVAAPLIDEMRRHGVRHVVNLTAMGVETRDDLALRKVERSLEESGIDFTHLRPNWFMQVFTGGILLGDIRATGAIHIPAAEAEISYIDARDIAAVAAAALTEPDHAGKAYTLTGPRAVNHHEVARLVSGAAGKPVRYVPISEEAAKQSIEAAGLSPERAERLIGFYRLVRQGLCAPVSPDVEMVLGRLPISLERFVKDHTACWR